jgi:glycosyltransferase involved in cell wall biosynthesis
MKNPTVSVIIPTYNRENLIGRAIYSVLKQTYQDFEIIVIDDDSTDNTREVIKEFQRKDKRIKYIKHGKNKGGSAARNTGIREAKGKYIAFQDSDDEWLSGKLEKQIKMFKKAPLEIGVIYTGFWRIEEDKKEYIPSDKIIKKEGDIHIELLKGNFVTTQSIVVRKECTIIGFLSYSR